MALSAAILGDFNIISPSSGFENIRDFFYLSLNILLIASFSIAFLKAKFETIKLGQRAHSCQFLRSETIFRLQSVNFDICSLSNESIKYVPIGPLEAKLL